MTDTATWQQAAAQVADEHGRIDAWTAQLAELRGGAVFRALDGGALRGSTAARWAQLERSAETAASRLLALRGVVADLTRILAVPDRDAADLARVRRLLHGAAVPLAPGDLPGPISPPAASRSSAPQLTIAGVNRLVSEDLRIIRGLLTEIGAVWALIRPRLEQADTQCRIVAEAARQDGDAAARGRIAAVAAGLEELRAALVTDPLGLADRPARLAELERAAAAERIAQCDQMLTALRHEESYARQLAVAGVPAALPDRAVELRARLSAALEQPEGEGCAVPDELEKIALEIARARGVAKELIDRAARGPARPVGCVRADCSGGAIDQATGVCEVCFRAPSGERRGLGRRTGPEAGSR